MGDQFLDDFNLPLHNVKEELVCCLLQFGLLCLSKSWQVDGECRLETGSIDTPATKRLESLHVSTMAMFDLFEWVKDPLLLVKPRSLHDLVEKTI